MTDRFVVAAFANRTRATAEEFAALAGLAMRDYTADYQELVRRDDVEVVLVCVPIPQLLAITRDCLAAGKHVICEKPPGVDLAEARQFLALADQYPHHKLLMTENFFYRDDLRLARSLVEEGAIGHPQLLLERWVDRLVPTPGEYSSTPWRYKPQYPGGPLLDGGVHSIATIRLLGGDITRLYARTEWLNRTMQAPSALAMTYEFASGPAATASGDSWATPSSTRSGTRASTAVRAPWSRPAERFALSAPTGHRGVSGRADRVRPLQHVPESPRCPHARRADRGHVLRQSVENMLIVLRALDSAELGQPTEVVGDGVPPRVGGVPLWRPRGTPGLFDGLACQVRRVSPTG